MIWDNLEHVNNPGSPTPDFDDDENCTSIVVIALFYHVVVQGEFAD